MSILKLSQEFKRQILEGTSPDITTDESGTSFTGSLSITMLSGGMGVEVVGKNNISLAHCVVPMNPGDVLRLTETGIKLDLHLF